MSHTPALGFSISLGEVRGVVFLDLHRGHGLQMNS